MKRVLWLLGCTLLVGAGRQKSSSMKEPWDPPTGAPGLMLHFPYESNYENLPKVGQLSIEPWSGDYWPTFRGGIGFRWNGPYEDRSYDFEPFDLEALKTIDTSNLSPAEKYDIYLGSYDYPLLQYERARTQILKTIEGSDQFDPDFSIPRWEGLCHAWAPATIGFMSPKDIRVVNPDGIEVTFGASDIKALLTYFLHADGPALGEPSRRAKTFFLGRRCNDDFGKLRQKLRSGDITHQEFEDRVSSLECRDVNAGAFHIVLTNQIALKDEGFIVDVTRDAEVWNQAIFRFETTELASRTGDQISERASEGTVKEVIVETSMGYITEIPHSLTRPKPERGYATKTYRYILELDEKNLIIGGEWLQEQRPDFMWKQTIPDFYGYFHHLDDLYQESIKDIEP